MKKLFTSALLIAVTIAICAFLPGCASQDYAGNASYTVKPFVDEKGAQHCCQVDIRDGKERAALDVHVVKKGDDYDVTLSERNVAAFQGQQIVAVAVKQAIDDAVKVAVVAELAPILPALAPAIGAVITSGKTGAVIGGAAAGIAVDKALAPVSPAPTPVTFPAK